MRSRFVKVASLADAERECPWAAVVAACEGGFMAFESAADYETWAAQV